MEVALTPGTADSVEGSIVDTAATVSTASELGWLLRQLGRQGRLQVDSRWTYREIAARTCYLRARDLHRELGGRYNEADTLIDLGDTQHAAGDPDAARDAWQNALSIMDELDHSDAEKVRLKLTDGSAH
jgi:hypothetical protein